MTAVATSLASQSPAHTTKESDGMVYQRLGIKPVINGVGTVTSLGGCIMAPEVIRAMEEATQFFVPLEELQKSAGEHIAKLLNVPAAMVTCGAASSLTVATATSMVRGDARKIPQLPDVTGLPFEVIQQKSHHDGYEPQMRLCGAKIVTVETRKELDAAISERTAMLFFLNRANFEGHIQRPEWIQVGKEHGIPTLLDAAADVPGKERLSQYVHEGFDLVAFSGGKGLLGPQSTGLLLGRQDLVAGAMEAISPFGGIGRGMKVGKEEIVGLVAAIERYLKVDHEAERRALGRRVEEMILVLQPVSGLRLTRHIPTIANEVPHLLMEWDENKPRKSSMEVIEQLKKGDPPIHIQHLGTGKLMVSVWMMRGKEHHIVARRLLEIFQA